MALPESIRVKLSSEAAEAISITAVVNQQMPLRELVEYMLAVAGKDPARIRELLLRGTLVSGASRFRWAGWEADDEDLRSLLATFPDPDPTLPFDGGRCVRAVLRGGRQAIEIPPDAPGRKGVGVFWETLMLTVGGAAVYAGYSYRDRADRYRREFNISEIERLRASAEKVKYSTLREQIRAAGFVSAELYVPR